MYLRTEYAHWAVKWKPSRNSRPPPSKKSFCLHYLGAVNYFRASLGKLPDKNGEKGKTAAEVLHPLYSLVTCKLEKGTSFEDI